LEEGNQTGHHWVQSERIESRHSEEPLIWLEFEIVDWYSQLVYYFSEGMHVAESCNPKPDESMKHTSQSITIQY
jgi:hypothetical protein